jgi:hypothetical protein
VFAVVDDAHVRHPYSTVVAEVIAHLVLVYVIFSCYRANGELATNVANSVSIVVEAKINEAAGANIADVVFVLVNISVIVRIHRFSAVVAVAVVVVVGAIQRLSAFFALMGTIVAFMDATPYDIIFNFIAGHYVMLAIETYEYVAFKNFHIGRCNRLTVLHFCGNVIHAVNFVTYFIHNDEVHDISDSLVVNLQYRATVGIDDKLLGVESFEDIHHTVIVKNELPVIVDHRIGSAFSVCGVDQVVSVSVGLFNIMFNGELGVISFHPNGFVDQVGCRHSGCKFVHIAALFVIPAIENVAGSGEYRRGGKGCAISQSVHFFIL